MRRISAYLIALTTSALFISPAFADGKTTRYLLEGVSTPAVYAALMKNPEDRSINARVLMEAAGCELVDYYLGVNNYKNYIIIDCGEETNLSALQILIFGSGGVSTGTATELRTAAQMAEDAKEAAELAGSYKVPE